MASFFEGHPLKTRPFPIKTRVILVLGIYVYIYIYMYVWMKKYIYIYTLYFIMYTYTSLFTVHHIDLQPKGSIFLFGKTRCLFTETGCRWRCETRRPRFATQSSDAFILNARAHCLALQMIFFSSPPQGSDDFCKVLRKQLVTQLNCGNHASCKEPRNTTRCSFYRGGRNKN